MNHTRSRAVSRAAIMAGLIACAMTLAACGGSSEATVTPSAERQAGNLGTRICVTNNTDFNADVTFTKGDMFEDGPLTRGLRRCGEGTFGIGVDVDGRITWDYPGDSNWQTEFWARNPWIGTPRFYLAEYNNHEYFCNGGGYEIGDVDTSSNGLVDFKITRLPDGQWKDFELTLNPSTIPSIDGQRSPIKKSDLCEK